jgi:hypothetical protein
MKWGIIATVLLGGLLAFSSAQAMYLDEDETLQITGKVFTQGSWRMEDSDSGGRACLANLGANCEGWTFPNTKRGQLIQHRNLLDIEMYHNVGRELGPDFTLLDQLGYRLRVKYFYDGVYDYGPLQYRTPRFYSTPAYLATLGATDRQGVIDARHLDTQKDPLWNAYVDLGRGPVKLRIGRQDLSWGESDGFRLLDMIEPLDNRFGFPLVEDLDDRRIPLWMVRPTLSIGTLGPLRNLTIDSYWVPGTIDNEVSPVTPSGNPFATGSPPGKSVIFRPSKNLGDSRGGGRLIGTLGDVTFSLGHYVTFNDIPSLRLRATSINIIPVGAPDALPDFLIYAPDAAFLVEFYQQQITGASATFALPFDPYTIVRMEAAHFWDERVFIPEQSVNAAVARCAAQLPYGAGPCPSPGVGDLPTKNVMRWMIGLDRNVWIRWLNPENTFFLSGQYFHTNIFNYDKDIANGLPSNTHSAAVANVPLDPVNLPGVTRPMIATSYDFVPRKQDEVTLTYLINTLVYHGTIQPQVFGAYDIRGVHAVVPSLSYQYGSNLVFTVKYAIIMGTYANLGFFRDRDQLLFRVQYNLS